MSTGHAILSPSGADRWMLCPGSAAMEQGYPDKGSRYADEGTAAHFLASECLSNSSLPNEDIGSTILVTDVGAEWYVPEASHNGALFKVDDEMARHVQTYLDVVADLARGGEVLAEQRLPISHITGEDGAHGTADAVILTPSGELIIIDLKYGMGNRVDAEENRQLMLYALGAAEYFGVIYTIESARLVIVQPRLDHISEWPVSMPALVDFAAEASSAAWLARYLSDGHLSISIVDNLLPGAEQCKWCKAKADCPALANFVQESIGCDFEDMTAELPVITGGYEDDGQELSAKLKAVDLIETWCKAVRGEVEARLFAGREVPGWKLVQGKKGNRAWANPTEAEALLKKMRVKRDEMYDYKLISPTTAEKLAKAKVIGERQWPKVQELIVQTEGKPSVAPESDKRPALVIAAPDAEGFEKLV